MNKFIVLNDQRLRVDDINFYKPFMRETPKGYTCLVLEIVVAHKVIHILDNQTCIFKLVKEIDKALGLKTPSVTKQKDDFFRGFRFSSRRNK